MNLFELTFWAILMGLAFLLARWISAWIGMNTWLVFGAVLIVLLGVCELAGRWRRESGNRL
jgi:hypothetical protein